MYQVPDDIIRELFDYWATRRRDVDVPRRADIDPTEIPRLLPHLYLLNVRPGPEYEFRLMGTHLVERMGLDPIGRLVSEVIEGEYLSYMERLFAKAVVLRQAIYSRSSYRVPDRDFLDVHRIILPLTRGGDDVAMLIVGQKFETGGDAPDEDLLAVMHTAKHRQKTLEVITG